MEQQQLGPDTYSQGSRTDSNNEVESSSVANELRKTRTREELGQFLRRGVVAPEQDDANVSTN